MPGIGGELSRRGHQHRGVIPAGGRRSAGLPKSRATHRDMFRLNGTSRDLEREMRDRRLPGVSGFESDCAGKPLGDGRDGTRPSRMTERRRVSVDWRDDTRVVR